MSQNPTDKPSGIRMRDIEWVPSQMVNGQENGYLSIRGTRVQLFSVGTSYLRDGLQFTCELPGYQGKTRPITSIAEGKRLAAIVLRTYAMAMIAPEADQPGKSAAEKDSQAGA